MWSAAGAQPNGSGNVVSVNLGTLSSYPGWVKAVASEWFDR